MPKIKTNSGSQKKDSFLPEQVKSKESTLFTVIF